MAEKKVTKKVAKKVTKKVATKTKKTGKSKVKKINDEPSDGGIVIVDDDIVIDQDKINEERRAYLEEARSQEAVD
jgi:ribosomal protein L18E